MERWVDKAIKESSERIKKELRKQLLELTKEKNRGDSMCNELEKTEFEKAVELLSVHFNVDEDEAKRMIEYSFAKTENAGADVCVDDKNNLNYHHEIKIPNYNHEIQLPVYDFSLNEPACDPPIIKSTAIEEVFIPSTGTSHIKYAEKENEKITSRNMEIQFEFTKLSDEKRNKIEKLAKEMLKVIKG